MDSATVLTVLRLASLGLGALLVGATLSVIRLHAVATRRAPSGSGLLPWHVLCVATGTLLLTGSGLAGVLTTLGGLQLPVPVRFGLYLGGTSLILASLVIIGQGQRTRVNRELPEVTVMDRRALEVDDDTTTSERPAGTTSVARAAELAAELAAVTATLRAETSPAAAPRARGRHRDPADPDTGPFPDSDAPGAQR